MRRFRVPTFPNLGISKANLSGKDTSDSNCSRQATGSEPSVILGPSYQGASDLTPQGAASIVDDDERFADVSTECSVSSDGLDKWKSYSEEMSQHVRSQEVLERKHHSPQSRSFPTQARKGYHTSLSRQFSPHEDGKTGARELSSPMSAHRSARPDRPLNIGTRERHRSAAMSKPAHIQQTNNVFNLKPYAQAVHEKVTNASKMTDGRHRKGTHLARHLSQDCKSPIEHATSSLSDARRAFIAHVFATVTLFFHTVLVYSFFAIVGAFFAIFRQTRHLIVGKDKDITRAAESLNLADEQKQDEEETAKGKIPNKRNETNDPKINMSRDRTVPYSSSLGSPEVFQQVLHADMADSSPSVVPAPTESFMHRDLDRCCADDVTEAMSCEKPHPNSFEDFIGNETSTEKETTLNLLFSNNSNRAPFSSNEDHSTARTLGIQDSRPKQSNGGLPPVAPSANWLRSAVDHKDRRHAKAYPPSSANFSSTKPGEAPEPKPWYHKPSRRSSDFHAVFSNDSKRSRAVEEIKAVKSSVRRVLSNTIANSEIRFISTCCGRTSLTMLADVLVKDFGCVVAIRKRGPLKLRCEKRFSREETLRLRVSVEPLNSLSSSVTITRSREDEFVTSRQDYNKFVAEIKHAFLSSRNSRA